MLAYAKSKMAAPMRKTLVFSKLSRHRVFGIGSVRAVSERNVKDRTPAQRKKNSPEYIEKSAGPWKNYTDFNAWKRRPKDDKPYDPQKVTKLLSEIDFTTKDDMPIDIPDPYEEKPKRCILCRHNIEVSYKNTQLLSQFVSSYTGRMYGRHVTGLCFHMQQEVGREIRKARRFGLMPMMHKQPKFMKDPPLFNPFQKKTYPPGQ